MRLAHTYGNAHNGRAAEVGCATWGVFYTSKPSGHPNEDDHVPMRVLSVASLRGNFVKDEVRGLERLGIKVDFVVKNSPSFLAYLPFLFLSAFKLIRGSYDLVHAHYVPHSALIPAILKKKPLVVTFHGTDANNFPWKSRAHFRLTRFVIRRSDAVIAVSEAMKKTLVDRMDVDQHKIEVVHCCGVDTKLFKPISKQVALKLTGLTARHLVLFVAGLRREKGVEDVLAAAWRIPTALFVLIGRGRLDVVPKNCLIMEEISHEELPLWICAANVLILPSKGEGAPNVIVESLACGTPVVASDVGGCGEEVVHGRTGFLIPVGDVDALVRAVRYLLTNRRECNEMGRRAREDMRARYEQMNQVKKLAKVYGALLQPTPE